MDNPVREVPGIITALTQGNSEEQAKALEDYFLPDAYFIHPYCRVPSFRDYRPPVPLPFVGSWSLNSRRLVQAVYEWYRILSPKISFTVDSIGTYNHHFLFLFLTCVFLLIRVVSCACSFRSSDILCVLLGESKGEERRQIEPC